MRLACGTARRWTSSSLCESLPFMSRAPPGDVLDGVERERLLALPCLRQTGAEAAVAARVRRAAEANLVPCPRVRVERAERVAQQHRPGALDVELLPGAAVELASFEGVADRPSGRLAGRREGRGATGPRCLVEAAGREPPGVAVVRHVRVSVALE